MNNMDNDLYFMLKYMGKTTCPKTIGTPNNYCK